MVVVTGRAAKNTSLRRGRKQPPCLFGAASTPAHRLRIPQHAIQNKRVQQAAGLWDRQIVGESLCCFYNIKYSESQTFIHKLLRSITSNTLCECPRSLYLFRFRYFHSSLSNDPHLILKKKRKQISNSTNTNNGTINTLFKLLASR